MQEQKEILGFNRSMLLQCIMLYVGIWGGLIASSYTFIVVLGITILTALFGQVKNVYYHLLFLIPFSVIFKLSPNSTSLHTYLMLVVGIVLAFRKCRFQVLQFTLLVMFSSYAILGMGDNYTTVIKLIFGLLLLYIFVIEITPDDFKNQIIAFSLGMLGSSLIGTMKDSWERIAMYFDDIDYVYVAGERTFRFSGLNYDPNYYSVGIIIAIFLCLRLYFNKQCNRSAVVALIIILTTFGFISYSKMFLLAIIILVFSFVICRVKSPKQMLFTILGVGLICLLFYIWADNSGYLFAMTERLSEGDISTGRFEIWQRYLEYIIDSPKTLFFGDGLGSSYYQAMGPHNAYIELVFFLGIFGGGIFILTILSIMSCVRYVSNRTFIHCALCGLFLIMIATLGIVTVNDLMFYFMLLWMSLNMEKEVFYDE